MNSARALPILRTILFWFLLGSCAGALAADQKIIHLRNKRISTGPKAVNQRAAVSETPVSGLFLIQFNGPLDDATRQQLEKMKVELVRFVPDDAFVVRLNNVLPSAIRQLPTVRWLEPFKAEYKIHGPLRANIAQPNAELPIKILLAPDVSPKELAQARASLKKFEQESSTRFGKILQGSATPVQLDALANSSSVLWIEPSRKMKLFDEIATKIVSGDNGVPGTRSTVQQLGFDGTGVTVAVADSGLDEGSAATMHPDLFGRVDGFFYYGALTDAADEHSHGTHVTGIVAGNGATGEADEKGYLYGLGVAPGAHIVAQRIFDGVGNYEAPPTYETLTHDAVRAGAKIGSNSWGDDTQGRYDLSAAEFDALVRDADSGTAGDQPYILEFSAGNAGPGTQTIGSPAVAKNVIASGAVENNRFDFFIYDSGQETMADFSSRGPCEDGRIKPDVVAPGTWISSLRSSLADDENAWGPISPNYLYQGGTSQAGPHVSGAAAVFIQYYRATVTNTTPSPALVKAALINSAVDADGEFGDTTAVPNNDEGWGRIDLSEIIGASRRYQFIDQAITLTNNQTTEQRVVIGSPDEPLKITLTYTDVPGFPAAIPALVNDLDLEVIAPNGDIFRGNQFVDGESVPNATANDNINNVEAVHISAPVPGEYIVRVRGRRIVEDARRDTSAIDQDFALVISGDIPFPGVGVIFFDRGSYTAPDTMKLKLIDFDLAASNSVAVHISSSTETNGENVLLFFAGTSGVFTGNVVTATGAIATDGKLQISHGDAIEARYQDASPSGARIATARGDLIPPIITNVSATNRYGRTVVSWQTDEPANSIVRFGTNFNLSASATNRTLSVNHEVIIDGLTAGTTYQFLVISADEAGNAATNNNNGVLFSVIVRSAATALLVNAYTPVDPDFGAAIPLTAYTDALDQTGVSYEVWNTGERGSPGTNDLSPFRIVLWRINDNVFSDNTLTTVEQNVLKTYLDNGGGLFLSSMELLSRIGTTASALSFRTNVLHVQAFAEDAMVEAIEGVDNDPATSGIDLPLDYSQYNSDYLELFGVDPDVSDTITLATNSTTILFDAISGRPAGLRFPRIGQDSLGRVVFLPFPLDAVPTSEADPNNRANLLRNVLAFLAPGVNGLGTLALDNSEYTIPSLVTVELADSDLAGTGQTTVTFSSDTATNAHVVALNETPTRGLFRGFITLVSATNSTKPGELRVTQGDTIYAEYFDASANGLVRATAEIDTILPVISNVSSTPEYEEATITWTTSKPTDALVQFVDSTFRERTGYQSELSTSHSVAVSDLLSDHLYFYQVVSRDNAGNTAIDDNHGNFYSFRTLKPFSAPWFDNLENSRTNWTVVNGEAGTTTWQLGQPNNGLETQAHSPTNAWGSNLNGNNIDLGDTTLASPAVELSGGNKATLHFWHSYDFSSQSELDIYESGQVYVSTNNGNAWTLLTEFSDSSFGWDEEEIDLTPYIGHVVRIGFYYGFFSFDSANHPGWLLDDISITVTNAVTPLIFKSVAMTNNQARLTFLMPAGTTYILESSTNLVNWSPLQTNTATSTADITFIDAESSSLKTRFYRLRK